MQRPITGELVGKLLVVDDNDLMRECVTAMLTALGYEVIQAKDGVEALLVYQTMRNDISLIVMDIVMPRMDGISAAKVIKETDPSAKVILMSGHSEQDPADAKADAFLPKPFTRKILSETVEQVLRDDRGNVPWAVGL